ncbi:MAG: phosphatidylserine decarboxylase family protein [Verrucomicrobiaceae bacterium]|nr:MAG: phosphatidylserine decarboxylase family protein [Verrucomicrobiaceae bacterium]
MRNRALAEARWILAILGVAWLFALLLLPAVSVLLAIAILFTFYFFRDPERVPPPGETIAVAPADGLVTTVDEVEEAEFLNAKVRRVGIFLSVLDVHVNRAPIAGEVTHSEPKSGIFLDARDLRSSSLNVSRTWVFSGVAGTVLVRQITGAIARRICPWAVVGDVLVRGERFGMIRFGSRTELFVPMDAEILVKLGDRVRGGETPVARLASSTGIPS